VVAEGYTYEADPCDARTQAEKQQDAQQQADRLRKGAGAPVTTEVVSAEMERQIAGVRGWAAGRRRKKAKGVEVEL
jgi:hypothetical protein